MTVDRRDFLKGMAVVPVVAAVGPEGNPLARKELWYFESDNITLLRLYKDKDLTIRSVNPLVVNEGEPFPEVFVKDTNYRGQLRDASGTRSFVSIYQ